MQGWRGDLPNGVLSEWVSEWFTVSGLGAGAKGARSLARAGWHGQCLCLEALLEGWRGQDERCVRGRRDLVGCVLFPPMAGRSCTSEHEFCGGMCITA